MLKLTAEEKIILSLSRLNPSKEIISTISCLLMDDIDYNRLYTIAVVNGVAPLLYKNLNNIPHSPEDCIHKFRILYLKSIAVNTMHSRELLHIVNVLQNHKIKVIPLKGVVASETVFQDMGVYPSNDIDILVPEADLLEADRILQQIGYVTPDSISKDDLLINHYHLVYNKNDLSLEIHWNLVKRYFSIPSTFWWDSVSEVQFENAAINALSIEKYIIYTIFRLFDHRFMPLKFFLLISEIINRHHNDIDWVELIKYSKEYKMEKLVLFVLRFLTKNFDIIVPLNLIYNNSIRYRILENMILTGIFRKAERLHLRELMYTIFLIESNNLFRILIGRLFPHTGEIRLRYGIGKSSKKVYLYYLLNPILLFMKNKKSSSL